MMIEIGQALPRATFKVWQDDGMHELSTDDVFLGKRVVLLGVPGAFTPACTNDHLASFAKNLDILKEKGIEDVACVGVNDAFVMRAWALSGGVDGKIIMLADGNAEFTQAIGMAFDASVAGLGTRSLRYTMLVYNGVVKDLYVETNPAVCEQTRADHILNNL